MKNKSIRDVQLDDRCKASYHNKTEVFCKKITDAVKNENINYKPQYLKLLQDSKCKNNLLLRLCEQIHKFKFLMSVVVHYFITNSSTNTTVLQLLDPTQLFSHN